MVCVINAGLCRGYGLHIKITNKKNPPGWLRPLLKAVCGVPPSSDELIGKAIRAASRVLRVEGARERFLAAVPQLFPQKMRKIENIKRNRR